ncbi:arsenate reductase family protein [Desmospora profundinema]|uniref:Arsenate reductase n=1 Tax=Desmospora profundinema TaxID=1571184 RepID=A0ABU1IMA3_9BACL|nr:arsenate reductase family protein [Desmospora profundinema]MDR6225917.1 arsenate reductase [Desmospora profundinema]
MALRMYEYPRCGTCRKAKKYLEAKGIAYEARHMVNEPPTREELTRLVEQSGLPLQKFFNTSGKKYRELNLKEKLKEMDDREKLELLASDGMLIKRPIVTDGTNVTVGFNEQTFDKVWG